MMLPPIGGGGMSQVTVLPPIGGAGGTTTIILPGAVVAGGGGSGGMLMGPPAGLSQSTVLVSRPQQQAADADPFVSTIRSQRGRAGGDGSPRQGGGGEAQPPPFGCLRVTVNGCKGLTRALADASARTFVRATLGQQVKATGPAKEGGPRPRFGDELAFDIRNDRDIAFELVARHGDDGGMLSVLATANVSAMPWIARGKFSGDVELRDAAIQPCGALSLSVAYEVSAASVAAAAMVKNAGATSSTGGDAAAAGVGFAGVTVRDPNALFSDAEIRDAFRAFDLDGNGFIGAAEIRHILTHIGEVVTDEEVDEMIRMVDRGGVGMVAFTEFYRMLSGGRDPPPELVAETRGGSAAAAAPGAAGGAGGAGLSAYGTGAAAATAASVATVAGGEDAGAPVDMASVLQQRNAKKAALEAFVRDNSIGMEQVKMALQTFRSHDKLVRAS